MTGQLVVVFLAGAVTVALGWVGSAYAEHVATQRGAEEDARALEEWRRTRAEEDALDAFMVTWDLVTADEARDVLTPEQVDRVARLKAGAVRADTPTVDTGEEVR